MRLFLDSEFTGLHQATTLISLGIVSEDGAHFYAEFTDYDRSQLDPWLSDNVIAHTRWLSTEPAPQPFARIVEGGHEVLGDRAAITLALREWLSRYSEIEFWGDCLAYDWVLFCELFGGARYLPEGVSYLPGDLVTLLRIRGIDPNASRRALAGIPETEATEHNALSDAEVLRRCYFRVTTSGPT